jgi:hypothetical protein
MGIRITKKDLKALQWIAEQGAMNVDQLRKVFYGGKTNRWAYQRLAELLSLNLIEKIEQCYFNQAFYRITPKAHNLLCSPSINPIKIVPMQRLKEIELPHYSALTDIRIHVERSGKVVSWTSDRVLALDPTFPKNRFKETHPDAMYVTKSGRRMAVEFERTKKSRKRVLSKIRAYIEELMRKDRFVDFVVWIVTTNAQQEAYSLARVSNAQKVLTLDEFKNEIKI